MSVNEQGGVKAMIGMRRLIKKWLRPLALGYCLLRYGGIWGYKESLQHFPRDEFFISVYNSYFEKMGSWIGYRCQFGGIPCFPHGISGVFISQDARLGKNVVIFQQVTIGSNTLFDAERPGSPSIGDNVYIGSGAKIIGGISIGDNCRIGANAVVYKDMPPHSVAVQAPTRIIPKKELDNRYFTQRADGTWTFYENGSWVVAEDGLK